MLRKKLLLAAVSMVWIIFGCGGGGGSEGGGNSKNANLVTISGTVLNSARNPVSGATVTLTDRRPVVLFSTTTDASGRFSGSLRANEQMTCTITITSSEGNITEDIVFGPGEQINKTFIIGAGQQAFYGFNYFGLAESGWVRGKAAANVNFYFSELVDNLGASLPDQMIPITGEDSRITSPGNPTLHGWIAEYCYFVVFTATSGELKGINMIMIDGASFSIPYPPNFLAGDWHVTVLTTGNSATQFVGWKQFKGTVNTAGQMTMSSYLDSTGNSSLDSISFANPISGDITIPGNPTFKGKVHPSGKFFVGTGDFAGHDGRAPAPGILIAQKADKTYTLADLAGSWFQYGVSIGSGSYVSGWVNSSMSIDSLGSLTWSSYLDSAEIINLPSNINLTVDPDGTLYSGGNQIGFIGAGLIVTASTGKPNPATTVGGYNLSIGLK